ncbi:MAG: hypothetical protein IJH48_09150 [Oscillospiraceae bacterium]|nr:hypothetical protein [Oscillospiraceae bacterium]
MAEHTKHKVSKKALTEKRAEELEDLREEDLEEELDDEEFDDEDEAPRRSGKKKAKRKKRRGFPVGGLILMLFLIAVILIAGYYGKQYMDAVTALRGEYESALQNAEAERDEAAALRAEADPDSAGHIAERELLTDGMIAEAESEAEALRKQGEETDAAIREAEKTISELQDAEGYEYYRAIYDEYVEGRAYVEGLLSGN